MVVLISFSLKLFIYWLLPSTFTYHLIRLSAFSVGIGFLSYVAFFHFNRFIHPCFGCNGSIFNCLASTFLRYLHVISSLTFFVFCLVYLYINTCIYNTYSYNIYRYNIYIYIYIYIYYIIYIYICIYIYIYIYIYTYIYVYMYMYIVVYIYIYTYRNKAGRHKNSSLLFLHEQ